MRTSLKPYLDSSGQGPVTFRSSLPAWSGWAYGRQHEPVADPGAYGQAPPGSRAATFAITHDIPTNDGFPLSDPQPDRRETWPVPACSGRDGGSPWSTRSRRTRGQDGLRWQDYYLRTDLKG